MLTPTRQWFRARHGIGLTEPPRSQAFCNYTLLQHDVFVVEDAIVDGRFRDNPLVTGEPHIRFYAGVPVHDADGHRLGGLCVIDRVARAFDARQRRQLSVLGEAVSEKIRLRLVDRRAKWMGATL
ncbi:GAF domain-containing protein [Paraburkholderia fungorum]|uniref:GAF domain-containing protein n=1 Tax=Paraburkholderia fungorum TaxID=134537 RepID=UPI00068E99A4|nr:GAF domain-containing protein [Paraburkholderia fungorum]USX07225.1 GAF domain-containing protein [Paraburkholderia fungorum]